jgi:hypothetical protein
MGSGIKHSTATAVKGTKAEPEDWNAEHTYDASLSTYPMNLVLKDTPDEALVLLNQTAGASGEIALDLSSYVSANAKAVYLNLTMVVDTVGAGVCSWLYVKGEGQTAWAVELTKGKDDATASVDYYLGVIVKLGATKTVLYSVKTDTGWQCDYYIHVLGYME